jgi:hypothetical protein
LRPVKGILAVVDIQQILLKWITFTIGDIISASIFEHNLLVIKYLKE